MPGAGKPRQLYPHAASFLCHLFCVSSDKGCSLGVGIETNETLFLFVFFPGDSEAFVAQPGCMGQKNWCVGQGDPEGSANPPVGPACHDTRPSRHAKYHSHFLVSPPICMFCSVWSPACRVEVSCPTEGLSVSAQDWGWSHLPGVVEAAWVLCLRPSRKL